jgi:hypothetical protein
MIELKPFCVPTEDLRHNEAQALLNLAVECGATPYEYIGYSDNISDLFCRNVHAIDAGFFTYLGVEIDNMATYLGNDKSSYGNNVLTYIEAILQLTELRDSLQEKKFKRPNLLQQPLFDEAINQGTLLMELDKMFNFSDTTSDCAGEDFSEEFDCCECDCMDEDESLSLSCTVGLSSMLPDEVIDSLFELNITLEVNVTPNGEVVYSLLCDDETYNVGNLEDFNQVVGAIKVLGEFIEE